MANYIRIKRRAAGGAAGAPSTLKNAELAFNEQDNVLYYGWGVSGAQSDATQILSIGGPGAYVTLNTSQTITGPKIFTGGLTATTLSAGSIVIPPNSITLGTDTTGNYVATVASGGTGSIGVTGSGSETAAITLDLNNTAVTPGSYGSSTSIPTFTVDAKGRLTAAGSASLATNLNIAGNSGTDAVALLTDTLTVTGGTGGHITTTVTNNAIAISTDATSANTANTIVSRDAAGNFVAGSISATSLTSQTTLTLTSLGANANVTITPAGTGTVDVSSKRITSVADPVNAQDAATKNYVDLAVQGLDPKQSVKAATVSAITLTGPQTIDGVSVTAGERVLVKDQAAPSANGIYVVAAGAWTRSTDMDNWLEVPGAYVFVELGTVNAENGFLCTSDVSAGPINVGAITWVQFSGAGQIVAGAGLTKTGNQLDVIGTANRITVNADNVDIAATYIGQTSINTLGTVSAGTWQGSTITVPYGGTGATTFAASGVLFGNTQGAIQATVAGVYAADGSQILSVGSDGKPAWTSTIDGGSF